MRVQSLSGTLVHIKHQILNALDKMLFYIQLVLRENLVKVLLKGFKPYRVALLMLAIVLTEFLQAIVSQVHVVVLILERVVV